MIERLLTANVQRTDVHAQQRETLAAIVDLRASLVNMQEVETQFLRARVHRLPYATVWPGGTTDDGWPLARPANAIPTLYDPDVWRLTRTVTIPSSPGLVNVSPVRYVARHRFEHVPTGRIVVVCNTHMVSGVDGRGKPPVEWRRTQHRANVAAFVNAMRSTHPCLGSGDMNTTRFEELMPTRIAAESDPRGTHGRRPIDWWAWTNRPDVTAQVERVTIRKRPIGFSDHRGLMLRVNIADAA